MAQDGNGARTTRSLMEAVAAVAPDLNQRRAPADAADAASQPMPPPLPQTKLGQPPPVPVKASEAAPSLSSLTAAAPPTFDAASVAVPTDTAEAPTLAAAQPLASGATLAPPPAPAPSTAAPAQRDTSTKPGDASQRRRPAGPSREKIAANDDVPTIGGLIYALNQKPSRKPFKIAAAVAGAWFVVAAVLTGMSIAAEVAKSAGVIDLLSRPAVLVALAVTLLPVALVFGVAWLLYHAEDLRLRSSAMTEVAIRLAEPDRSAEQAIASLGQSVRKQVGYMNEAISQAIGRAGELEAMVHNEVAALETSFQQNETRIRGLLTSFANQRDELTGTSGDVHGTLKAISDEVPALIEKLTTQQLKLSSIIENAGQNLIALEGQLTTVTDRFEGSLATRTGELRGVLTDTTTRLESTLSDGTERVKGLLTDAQDRLQGSFSENAGQVQTMLVDRTNHLQTVLDEYTSALHASLGARTGQLQNVFEEFTLAIDKTLDARSQSLNASMITQVDRMDASMIERTKALDAAFASRLQVLDDSIQRSSAIIDGTVGEKARLLASAMETHARQLSETLSRQSQNLDETLLQGINSVRRTSENITRQSVKAIEGLSSQADMLKNVSENLLAQIGTVTTRFENQGQSILRAANSLESANYRIDQTLQARHRELTDTLGRVTEASGHLGEQMSSYKSGIEGSLAEATQKAKLLTDEMARSTQAHVQSALSELERLKLDTDQQAGDALQTVRSQVSNVQRELQSHVGSLSSRLVETSEELRARSRSAQQELEREQLRLRQEAQKLPEATRESVDGMRRMLQEQIRALDQVQQIASRAQSDISPPAAPPPQRALPSAQPTTATLANAIAAASAHLHAPGPAPSQPAPAAPPVAPSAASGWSLGDLLARASKDDPQQAVHAAVAQPVPMQAPAGGPMPINLEQIAAALDAQTAGAIWTRFRSGQRGILVRSIYSAEGRVVFDDLQRRYHVDLGFKDMIDRFMAEFERELRDIEARDTTGQALQQHLVSHGGRVYLFLAHASGRLN